VIEERGSQDSDFIAGRSRRTAKASRRDSGDETLAESGRSYNVSGWTMALISPT
jgi:hypothetical protein